MRRKKISTAFTAIALLLLAVESSQSQVRLRPANGSQRTTSPLRRGFVPQHERNSSASSQTAQPSSRQPIRMSRVAQQTNVGPRIQSGVYQENSRGTRQDSSRGVRLVRQDEIIGPQGEIIDDGVVFDDGGPIGGNNVVFVPQTFQLISFADMEYSAGVQAFSGIPNQVNKGSFGFNESINWGFPIPVLPVLSLTGQAGVRFTQTEFNGQFDMANSPVRNQMFWTAGIARRVDYGLQFGLVVDGLSESWFHDSNFTQLRGELGLVGGAGNQFGFRFTANLLDDRTSVVTGLGTVGGGAIPEFPSFDTNDTYRFFYRNSWDQVRGGYVEVFGGFSENSEAVMGAEFLIPIAERWALTSDFTFLPTSSDRNTPTIANTSPQEEAWNVGMGLTWYPKGLTEWSQLYHRPLMRVADNGTMLFKKNR